MRLQVQTRTWHLSVDIRQA